MSWVATTFLVALIGLGGLIDGIYRQVTDGSDIPTTEQLNEIVASVRVLSIDDASLNDNPTNAALAGGGGADRSWWDTFRDSLTFNYGFLIGQLQIVRYFLWFLAGGIAIYLVLSWGNSLITAIRNAGVG